ncbi:MULTISPECIES: hypothetical protein [unclassified Streptomyces]|uniref:hypothetical protein n=1 Tax=unclassified Streptomyces TaxID=2593676 RepID=UPI003814BFD2
MSRRSISLLTMGMVAVPLAGLSASAVAAASQHAAPTHAASADFCRITGSSATVRAEPRTGVTGYVLSSLVAWRKEDLTATGR